MGENVEFCFYLYLYLVCIVFHLFLILSCFRTFIFLRKGLRNIDGIDSVIADPRIPNLKRLNKSVKFLIDHPEEAAIRAVEGLPTHQPLAQLLPRLIKTCETNDNVVKLTAPRNLRLHVDDTLVETLRKALITCDENESHECLNVWNNYWEGERCRIESNKKVYGGTAPRNGVKKVDDSETRQIIDSREALEVFQLMDLIVGFHPDQATESTIDLALLLQVPFAVVPCCVFPKEFPNRTLDGKRVRSHGEFVDYLCLKHPQIRKEKLSFVETETGKNVVLYMTKEDFC